MVRVLVLALSIAAATPASVPVTPPADTAVYAPQPAPPPFDAGFDAWLAAYRAGALARGVSAATLDAALADLSPSPRVVELDRAQPGDSGAGPARFDAYLARRLDATRIAAGNATAQGLAAPLAGIAAKSGVPAEMILGIWGMETNYGRVTGDFDVTRALATLAWDGRRRELFTKELDAVVTIIDRGLASRAMLRGSWAGAMGQPQFLPSSYLAYAMDGDGDGRADIWNSDRDTAASIANYLGRHGWQRGLMWGMPVTVPAGFDRAAARNPVAPLTCIKPMEKHSRWLPAAEWRRLGIAGRGAFPADDVPMSLLEPDGPDGMAFLTTANYRVIMDYNCSNFYALSVALLGDAIAGR